MDYLDVKALSEVVDAYHALFFELSAVRERLAAEGVDSGPLRRKMAPVLRRAIRSYRTANTRYDAACAEYMKTLPKSHPGALAS